MSSWNSLDINPHHIWFWNIFPCSASCNSVAHLFCSAEAFQFDIVSLVNFHSCCMCCWWHIQKDAAKTNILMFKLDLEKAEEPGVKLPTSVRSSKKQESSKKNTFCSIDYAKAFEHVHHNKLWEILQEMGTPGHLTWLLRNLCAGQEVTVRTGHGTTDWFQISKGVHQGHVVSPWLFNFYAEYIM